MTIRGRPQARREGEQHSPHPQSIQPARQVGSASAIVASPSPKPLHRTELARSPARVSVGVRTLPAATATSPISCRSMKYEVTTLRRSATVVCALSESQFPAGLATPAITGRMTNGTVSVATTGRRATWKGCARTLGRRPNLGK